MCLGDPEFGYYRTNEPFGRAGDFVTAPEDQPALRRDGRHLPRERLAGKRPAGRRPAGRTRPRPGNDDGRHSEGRRKARARLGGGRDGAHGRDQRAPAVRPARNTRRPRPPRVLARSHRRHSGRISAPRRQRVLRRAAATSVRQDVGRLSRAPDRRRRARRPGFRPRAGEPCRRRTAAGRRRGAGRHGGRDLAGALGGDGRHRRAHRRPRRCRAGDRLRPSGDRLRRHAAGAEEPRVRSSAGTPRSGRPDKPRRFRRPCPRRPTRARASSAR